MIGEGNIFETKENSKLLSGYIKKSFSNEEVLEVQRQHFVVIVFKLAFLIILSILIIIVGIFAFQHRNSLPLSFLPSVTVKTAFGIGFIILSVFSTLGTYIFMRWYYQFYLITTKRVMHVHFFRIQGFYEEEIFFEKLTEKEVDRNAPNILYDLLGIEDVYMYMATFERPEPFVFKTPQNAQRIEEILEKLALANGGKRR